MSKFDHGPVLNGSHIEEASEENSLQDWRTIFEENRLLFDDERVVFDELEKWLTDISQTPVDDLVLADDRLTYLEECIRNEDRVPASFRTFSSWTDSMKAAVWEEVKRRRQAEAAHAEARGVRSIQEAEHTGLSITRSTADIQKEIEAGRARLKKIQTKLKNRSRLQPDILASLIEEKQKVQDTERKLTELLALRSAE